MISAKHPLVLSFGACLSLALTSSNIVAQDNPPVRSAAGRQAPPNKYLVVPGLEPLSLDSVQQEIQLTAEQKQQLKQLSDAFLDEAHGRQTSIRNEMKSLQNLPEAEQQKRAAVMEQRMYQQMSQLEQGIRHKAEAMLSPQQVAQVREIAFRLFVADVLTNPGAQQHIGLDPRQLQQVTAIYEDEAEQLHRMRRKTASQILKTLTPEQQAELRKDMENPPQQPRQ